MEMPDTEFFVGLAFKYSKNQHVTGEALRDLCKNIPQATNIIPTTSGRATGQPAEDRKVREIREYLPSEKRLGIASGITTENAPAFLDLGITDFLVATSLINENRNGFDILSEKKIRELAKIILT
jgi:predicted TIM-barrel enzyme